MGTGKSADMFDLTGKNFLITGASSGLGEHFARTLGHKGAALALAARRLDRLQSLVDELKIQGIQACAIEMDVTQRESVLRGFDAAQDAMGSLSGLINNAGTVSENWILDVEEAEWSNIMATNLNGAWWVAQEAARRMSTNGGGTIVNIASILGFAVSKTTAVYAISKAGVIQMTKAMALELARHNISVNALAPGYFQTDMNQQFFNSKAGRKMVSRIPQARLGKLEELDAPLLLLASDTCGFMTGTVITIDGGQSLVMG
jgi:NAD(P)-dependent dehydrogenase (short-subunit alcohol dehydrogenase family)